MLKIEKFVTPSPEQWEIVIEGMRNPKNSWDRIDSYWTDDPNLLIGKEVTGYDGESFMVLGDNDLALMDTLNEGGPVHAKYRRMLPVWVTLTAPLYFYKEMDTYKVGVVCNSCSTMHKIHSKKFTVNNFSHEHLTHYSHGGELGRDWLGDLEDLIDDLNFAREKYLETKDKKYWWQMIQLLPSSYNQKRTYTLNYEVLANIYRWRRHHKLDEWHTFCDWIEALPYSELITGGDNGAQE